MNALEKEIEKDVFCGEESAVMRSRKYIKRVCGFNTCKNTLMQRKVPYKMHLKSENS